MYPAGNLLIPVGHGQLEAIIKEPRQGPPRAAALVLHPHPLGGGTMHNKVVFRAAAALNDAGLVTLRFNFRGVGQSTGKHDEGRGEQDDARAALDYLATQYPQLRLVLCGFSFGSRVGLDVGIHDDRVQYLIGIGTPLDKYDFSFLESCRKPLLLVHGEHDEYGDVGKVQQLAAELEQRTQVRLVVIPGAGHFFENRLDELKQAIFDWINEQLAS
ncbi:MAG TPA: alpha/beta fold hydrolase [Pyrinomonadaceae bacterium]|jgi:alpha/beta superfamily hydrolase|nr:alpha/beta fold hydrolase [Pyrinomonadaceae bacterium]